MEVPAVSIVIKKTKQVRKKTKTIPVFRIEHRPIVIMFD